MDSVFPSAPTLSPTIRNLPMYFSVWQCKNEQCSARSHRRLHKSHQAFQSVFLSYHCALIFPGITGILHVPKFYSVQQPGHLLTATSEVELIRTQHCVSGKAKYTNRHRYRLLRTRFCATVRQHRIRVHAGQKIVAFGDVKSDKSVHFHIVVYTLPPSGNVPRSETVEVML